LADELKAKYLWVAINVDAARFADELRAKHLRVAMNVDVARLADELRAKHLGVAMNVDVARLADDLRADLLGYFCMVDVARLADELRAEQVWGSCQYLTLLAWLMNSVPSVHMHRKLSPFSTLLSDMVIGSFLLGKKIYLFPARLIAKPNCLSIPLTRAYTYTLQIICASCTQNA